MCVAICFFPTKQPMTLLPIPIYCLIKLKTIAAVGHKNDVSIHILPLLSLLPGIQIQKRDDESAEDAMGNGNHAALVWPHDCEADVLRDENKSGQVGPLEKQPNGPAIGHNGQRRVPRSAWIDDRE